MEFRRSFASRSVRVSGRHGGASCPLAAVFLFALFFVVSASLATAGTTTVKRGGGTHDFGESKASTRNKEPKSSSYYSRGKTESQKRRELHEEMWDDLTSPRVHQSGGYCMYGLDGNLIHAPAGRACAQTESENESGHGNLSN
jgi:hypothetical protein